MRCLPLLLITALVALGVTGCGHSPTASTATSLTTPTKTITVTRSSSSPTASPTTSPTTSTSVPNYTKQYSAGYRASFISACTGSGGPKAGCAKAYTCISRTIPRRSADAINAAAVAHRSIAASVPQTIYTQFQRCAVFIIATTGNYSRAGEQAFISGCQPGATHSACQTIYHCFATSLPYSDFVDILQALVERQPATSGLSSSATKRYQRCLTLTR
jgi:hypothetical protein